MFTTQRAAQFGLGAVAVVLVLCLGVLIANGMGKPQSASGSSSDLTLIGSEGCGASCEALVAETPTVANASAPVRN